MAGEITGPPAVDFYGMLSGLGDQIAKQRAVQEKRDAMAAALQPGPNGTVDFGRAALGLLQVDPTAAAALTSMANHKDTLAQQAIQNERQLKQDAWNQKYQGANLSIARARLANELDPTPEGFEKGTDGGLRPIAGGPKDPEYLRSATKPRQLSISDITKLSDEGQKFGTLKSVHDGFQDRFAGYIPGTGDLSMKAGRYLPEGIAGKDRAEGAAYWQEYDRYKNVVRNDLFGSALTKTEQAAFAQADVDPSMQPAQVKKNLARQREIVETGLKRKASAMLESGYDPVAVGKAYGVDLSQMGVAPKGQPVSNQVNGQTINGGRPIRVTHPRQAANLPSGTKLILPDGSEGVVP